MKTKKINRASKKLLSGDKITNECSQCSRQMSNAYGNKYVSLPFCSYPECPNFRLLQTPITPKKFLLDEDKGEL